MTFDETTLAQSGGNAPAPVAYDPNEFWLRTLLRWYIGLVIRPVPTIREIVERRAVRVGAYALGFYVLLSTTVIAISPLIYDERSESVSDGMLSDASTMAVLPLFAVAWNVVIVLIPVWAFLLHGLSRLVGGKGSFRSTLGALLIITTACYVLYSIALALLVSVTSLVMQSTNLPSGGEALVLLGVLWANMLAYLLVRQNYRMGYLRTGPIVIGGVIVTLPLMLYVRILAAVPVSPLLMVVS